MRRQQRYQSPLFPFITKLIGNVLLCFVLCGSLVNAANISFNREFAFWRNKSQLIPTLIEGMGIDSLSQFVSSSPLVYLKISIDSLGYPLSLDRLSFVLKKKDNKVIDITGSKLKHIEKCMVDNGTQLTFSPAVLMDLQCPSDSVKDVITMRLNAVIPKYFRGDIPTYYTFKLCDADILSDYGIYWNAPKITKQVCDDKHVFERPENYRVQTVFNDAIIFLSMIYTFGDYNVNKWLDDYSFDLNLSLDADGLATQISFDAEKIPPNLDLQQLTNFLRCNNVRFNLENGNRLVTFKFPGSLYDETTGSKGFLNRMEILEAKLWYILSQEITSRQIPFN